MDPSSAQQQTFFRWVGDDGRVHVVSSLDAVPAAERAHVERVTLNGAASLAAELPSSTQPAPWAPDALSAALGFGAALVLVLVFRLLPGSLRWASRLAIVAGLAILLMGAYLGLIRRSTGAPRAGALAAPSALIQQARDAVDDMQARQKQQAEEIRKIQAEGR